MRASELVSLLSHYPDAEVLAHDRETGDCEPVSEIEFNAASESVELRTFRKRKAEECLGGW